MLEFYKRYLRPERAILVTVGDVEPAEIVALAQELFGGWQAEGEVEPYSVPTLDSRRALPMYSVPSRARRKTT